MRPATGWQPWARRTASAPRDSGLEPHRVGDSLDQSPARSLRRASRARDRLTGLEGRFREGIKSSDANQKAGTAHKARTEISDETLSSQDPSIHYFPYAAACCTRIGIGFLCPNVPRFLRPKVRVRGKASIKVKDLNWVRYQYETRRQVTVIDAAPDVLKILPLLKTLGPAVQTLSTWGQGEEFPLERERPTPTPRDLHFDISRAIRKAEGCPASHRRTCSKATRFPRC